MAGALGRVWTRNLPGAVSLVVIYTLSSVQTAVPVPLLALHALSEYPADLWLLFDACVGLPLALIRGANSDVLSRNTAEEMQRRRQDMISVEIADRAHTPFLDEPEALRAIQSWLVRTDAIQRE